MPSELEAEFGKKVRRILVGKPRDLEDRSLFHHISLVPFLAWVGLGADGLSSSAYGPDEAFRTLGAHTYLAVGLAGLTAITIFIIATAYSRIIEQFPNGGGGYFVATKLLGERVGVVSGCALLVDYMLTITVSIAAAGEAIFSMVPHHAHLLGVPLVALKVPLECITILLLITLNIRGVKESVLVLMPIFVLFLITHAIMIVGGIFSHASEFPSVAHEVGTGFHQGVGTLGLWGMFLLFIHAYSLGGGTYTGLEAVSNGLPIMREPRVKTAQRTMIYMSVSLAFTAAGLLVCYLLWHVKPDGDKTLNAVLVERFTNGYRFGGTFVFLTLVSEALLLVVAALAGFLDGPRVLANMATDSWMPRRFAALSDRLTTQNGIMLMGVASLLALLYTHGEVRKLVIMYSINVFLTFSLSMFGMMRWWIGARKHEKHWRRRATLFTVGFVLCATILCITVFEKFMEGGYVTLLVTGLFIILCYIIRHHYENLTEQFKKLNEQLGIIDRIPLPKTTAPLKPDPDQPTAAILVGGYGGLGIHTILNIHRTFPGHFKNMIFLSVAVIDSGRFKGEDEMDHLRQTTNEGLHKYVELARRMGFASECKMSIGTEVVSEAERLCIEVTKELPRTVFFTGKLMFQKERWYQKILHNQTAIAIQKRLQWDGMPMVIMPIRVREDD